MEVPSTACAGGKAASQYTVHTWSSGDWTHLFSPSGEQTGQMQLWRCWSESVAAVRRGGLGHHQVPTGCG